MGLTPLSGRLISGSCRVGRRDSPFKTRTLFSLQTSSRKHGRKSHLTKASEPSGHGRFPTIPCYTIPRSARCSPLKGTAENKRYIREGPSCLREVPRVKKNARIWSTIDMRYTRYAHPPKDGLLAGFRTSNMDLGSICQVRHLTIRICSLITPYVSNIAHIE